jgi:hypothetical protein
LALGSVGYAVAVPKPVQGEAIHERMGVACGSVGAVLSQLEDQGDVCHRGEYWGIGNFEDIDVTLRSRATTCAATDHLGSEDPDEWGPMRMNAKSRRWPAAVRCDGAQRR